jgi:hypothetical protein
MHFQALAVASTLQGRELEFGHIARSAEAFDGLGRFRSASAKKDEAGQSGNGHVAQHHLSL